jgi:hypothetical protein
MPALLLMLMSARVFSCKSSEINNSVSAVNPSTVCKRILLREYAEVLHETLWVFNGYVFIEK